MESFDDVAVKKMDAMLKMLAEKSKFDSDEEDLTAEDLDAVTGGVAVPNFQKFLQYARERSAKEKNK
jgi:hypothetical protein